MSEHIESTSTQPLMTDLAIQITIKEFISGSGMSVPSTPFDEVFLIKHKSGDFLVGGGCRHTLVVFFMQSPGVHTLKL